MRWLAFLFFLVLAPIARAEDVPVVQDIPPGVDQIEVIMQGKPAPFTGQLYSQETALRWANWLGQYRLRLVQDVDYEKRVCAANLSYKDAVNKAEADRDKAIQDDLRTRIMRLEQYNAKLNDKINNPSFFRTAEFGFIVGILGSAAVALGVGIAAVH
jgi:hypothetical protein